MNELIGLVRWKNLLIIALAQYFIEYFLIIPGLKKYALFPYLSHFEFFLLVLCTVIIAAGGNVVNDLYDVEIDKINKPDKRIIAHTISLENGYRLYFVLVGVGALIAIYLAFQVGRLSLFILYPIAVGMLWSYSRWFKRLPLSGNLIISVFTGCIPLILLVPEWKNVIMPGFRSSMYLFTVFGFSYFAFITNLIREVVKDLEDLEGDKAFGAATIPAMLGIARSLQFIQWLLGILIFTFVLWPSLFYFKMSLTEVLYFVLLLIPFTINLFILTKKASSKADFHRLSMHLKGLMVLGLCYLFILNL